MENDVHTILDGLTLIATLVVIYTIRFTSIAQTYQKEQDTVKLIYVVSPLEAGCSAALSCQPLPARGRPARPPALTAAPCTHARA